MPFYHIGQRNRQLVQVGDVKERVTINSLYIGFVVSNSGGYEQDTLLLLRRTA